jgi:transcriptional regulator with XRE-family HTH domain
MTADPIDRLPEVFGHVLARYRDEKKLTVAEFANNAGYSSLEILNLEGGHCGPTFRDFFRLARALGLEPPILFLRVIAEWRSGPFDMLHTSRSSDFARLFRLGYDHRPGDFRELPAAYYSVAEATHAAGRLNARRHTRGMALLDTVTMYVRLDSVVLRSDTNEVTP